MGCPSVSVWLIWYRLSWSSLALGEAALPMTLLTACSLRSSSSWMIAAETAARLVPPVRGCSGTAGETGANPRRHLRLSLGRSEGGSSPLRQRGLQRHLAVVRMTSLGVFICQGSHSVEVWLG